MITTCNSCGKDFTILPQGVLTLHDGGYDISYFECPYCKTKYQVCTFDKKMRDLIDRRRQIERSIRIAKAKNFRKDTIKKYLKEYDEIKTEQKRLSNELKPIGEEILKQLEKGEGDAEEHNSDQS